MFPDAGCDRRLVLGLKISAASTKIVSWIHHREVISSTYLE